MNSIELFSNNTFNLECSSTASSSDENEEVLGTSGLINQGNTCYMNSIIQCLSNCDDFRNFVIGRELIPILINHDAEYFIEKSKLDQSLAFQLRKIFINIWNSSFFSFRPISFRKLFGKKIELFQNSNQHDSQEALLCILDTINDELAKNVQINPKDKNLIYDCLEHLHIDEDSNIDQIFSIIKSTPSEYLNYKSINDYKISHKKFSEINNIFEGRIISQLTCSETQGIKANFESFFYFTLAFPEDKYEENVEPEVISSSSEKSSKSKDEHWCKLCNKDLQSQSCYNEHVLGKKHKRNELLHIQEMINNEESDNDSIEVIEYQYSDEEEQCNSDEETSQKTHDSDEETSQKTHDSDEEQDNSDEEQDDSDEEQDDSDEETSHKTHEFEDESEDSSDDETKSTSSESDNASSMNLFSSYMSSNKPKKLKEFTLDQLFENHTKPEKLEADNKWLSPYADNFQGKLVEAVKHNYIWDSPKILIILLKRFEYTYTGATKLNNIINFPFENFDITPYLHPNNVSKYKKYDLFAINNHTNFSNFGFNGISFGHYYSYCKNYTNGKWYNYDDDKVTESSESKIITKHAYMLFYRAKE